MGLKLYNLLNDLNLFQLIDEPTRYTENSAHLLDLIITDLPGFMDNVSTMPPIGDLDHEIIFGHLNIRVTRPASVRRTVWHFNRANFGDLNQEFLNAPWNAGLMIYDNINDLLGYYYGLIKLGMETHIPKRTINKRKKDKPWMTGYIRHLLSQRNKWNGIFGKSGKLEDRTERNRLRSLCKKEIRIAKAKYRINQTAQLSDPNIGVKKYWSIMKEIYGNKIKASIPTLIDDNVTYSTDIDKANLFADLFSSQCSLDPPPPGYSLPDLEYLTDQRLSNVVFEVDQVYRILKSLDIGKATGPDGIGNRLLKECADTLAVPLTDIYNKSMNDMIFPDDWKLSHISPVYKKAFRHIKENYRPVSLLACMSKPMERIIYNSMYNFFKSLGLLSTRNSGFKEKDSTINQLIHLCHNYRPRSEGDNVLGSVRPSVRPSVCPSVRPSVRQSSLSRLNRLTYDLDIWYVGRP